ncbi:MAG: CRISPR-associated protein Csx3 [Candidatus Nomurabacteria bacterium]|jgi:CRISPR-associated protein Csx3|nr:CRISPR-associated protein Csx3 [Candidatus Nomurabacteria bacterium]
MAFYNVEATKAADSVVLLTIGFGDGGTNVEIVPEAAEKAEQVAQAIGGGKTLLVSGPASLPVAFALAHAFGHLFQCVAVKDPKLNGFVVSVSHGGPALGTLLGETGEAL